MNFFKEKIQQLRRINWPPPKRLMILGGILFAILLLLINIFDSAPEGDLPADVNFTMGQPAPRKSLDYDFISMDTLEIPNFRKPEKPRNQTFTPKNQLPEPRPAPKTRFKKQPKTVRKSQPTRRQNRVNVNKNPNMIVMNQLAKNPVQPSNSAGAFTGRESALVKVMLPAKTKVANSSLVEARVLRDFQWKNITIPRRSRLIGTASLLNRRVQIDFREIIINGKSHSCSGRAYDLKRLQGLAYSPVNAETKRVVEEELRDAVTGVPILGRVANRRTLSNSLAGAVATLDEGLEFYVMINSIY